MLTTAKITNSYRPEFFPASCNYPLSVPLVDYPFPKKSPYSIRHSVEASSTQTKKIQDRQKSHTENATPIIMWIASPWGRGGGGTRHMKGVGMFVVSLRGVNFGFWYHLICIFFWSLVGVKKSLGLAQIGLL